MTSPNEVTIVVKAKDQASAVIDRLAAKIRGLPDAHIDVDVDAGEAEAELAAVDGALGHVDGKTAHANIDVDTRSALIGIGVVMAAIGGLAAAGAAVGLGAVAGAGIGAAVAGLSGIGDATKALGEQTKGAGAAASQAASQQLTLAGAMDRVRSAQASLANTRQDAADSERRAAQQVADAEQGLTRAQQDLNSARADAARQLEDLARQEEDLALTQRGAALDVAEAQEHLNDVMADRRSTALQRSRAQLMFDEAVQRNKELGEQAEALAAKKADADRRGVAGSAQVVTAQQRVKDAAQAVARAQQAAAETQRHAAFQVAQAQQSVVDAQRAVQAASIAAGSAGAAGVDKINDAMKNLSPTGQEFARFLRGFIDGPIRDLRFATQEGLLPGLQKGLAGLGPVIEHNLPAIKNFAKVFGEALGGLIEVAGRLTAPFLKLATVGLQALAPLKGVLDGFADAFARMVDKMVADGSLQKMMDGLVRLFGALLDLLPKIIPDLVDLAIQVLPPLTDLLVVLVPTLVEMAKALTPLLTGALKAVTPMIKWLGDWAKEHPQAFRDIAVALLAIVGAVKLWGILQPILNSGLLASPIFWIAVAIAGIGLAVLYCLNHFKSFGVFAVRVFNTVSGAAKWLWEWTGKVVAVGKALLGVFAAIAGAVVGKVVTALHRIGDAGVYAKRAFEDALRAFAKFITAVNIDVPMGAIVNNIVKNNQPGAPSRGRAYASGGVWGSGVAEIADRGRELVKLPNGSMVIPNGTTENMLAGTGRPMAVTLEVRGSGGGRFEDMFLEMIREFVRVRGGNVQTTFGVSR